MIASYYFFKKSVNQKGKLTATTQLFLCVPGECFKFSFTYVTDLKEFGKQT